MADLTTQHTVTLGPDRVTKRFTRWDRGEPHREWRGLTLLATHAPGLAPRPLTCELTAAPPTITMTRLPGTPLRGTHLDAARTAALATAVTRLHEALPRRVLTAVPLRGGHAAETVASLRTWYDSRPGPHSDPFVERAFTTGARWLAGPDPDRLAAAEPPPVLGLGDGNLANYLWDGEADDEGEGAGEGEGADDGEGAGEGERAGSRVRVPRVRVHTYGSTRTGPRVRVPRVPVPRVRIVDFEDSGRSDRAFELADITEHVSAWADTDLPADTLVAHLGLTPAEAARLHSARRLLAVVWLFLLDGDARSARPRNPPGTVTRQAARVRERLA